jgi:hypothetical protein
MKKLMISLFLIVSVNTYCQTEYFTTDGKSIITKAEAEELLTEKVNKMTKILKKQLFGNLTIEETETKNDSIISKISFSISDIKKENLINFGPLSEFKNKEFPTFDLMTLTEKNFNS